jgi:hypothetical protein
VTADLVAFLNARLAETEAEQAQDVVARRLEGGWHNTDCCTYDDDPQPCDCGVPARVLADVQAKRTIIARHEPWRGKQEGTRVYCSTCVGYPIDTNGIIGMDWPCPTLRLLAQPFVDHPDFDPSWRVSTAAVGEHQT